MGRLSTFEEETMNVLRIAEQVKNMKGLIPEPNRTLVAYRFMKIIGEEYRETDRKAWKIWQNGGQAGFLKNCALTDGVPRVEETFDISVSDLADFINRWSNAVAFKREEDDESEPLSADMNSLRQTMINELIEIYNRKEENEERT